MSQFVFKMPDLGEGTVEAEIVAWHTQPGAEVAEDQVIVEVMTDKAAVEVPAPVSGRVVSISGAPGDKIAVGSPLIVFETNGAHAPAANARRAANAASTAPAAAAPASLHPCPRVLRPRAAVSSADEGKSGAEAGAGRAGSGHGLARQSAPGAGSRHRSHAHCGLRSRRPHRARRFDRSGCRCRIGSIRRYRRRGAKDAAGRRRPSRRGPPHRRPPKSK